MSSCSLRKLRDLAIDGNEIDHDLLAPARLSPGSRPIRIAFLIRQLRYGGAERQLINLVAGMNKSVFDISIISFYDWGELVPELERVPGIRHVSLHKAGRWDGIHFTARLLTAIRQINPDIIHGYMGPANLMSLLGGKLFGAKVVWGVRASNMDLRRYDWLPRLIFQAERWTSRWPDVILANSYAGMSYHIEHGFPSERTRVIHNGIDTRDFKPHLAGRRKIRKEWQLASEQVVIGLVARLDPMKNHPLFLKAAALLNKTREDLVFVCVGDGPGVYLDQLKELADRLDLATHMRWTGYRPDMVNVYSALDICVSTSAFGEGVSNSIAEAMACGVPCIVTATGDAAVVVGDTGLVVESNCPKDIASAWAEMLERVQREREFLSRACRQRIIATFGRRQMIRRTEQELLSVVDHR